MSTKSSSRFTPVIIAISVVIGILIGTFYAKHFAGNRLGIINGSSNKLNALLRIVDDQYVDTVNMTDLVEKAMPQILAELDPHSTYIPAQNLEEVNSELEGSFSGIGIQFTIQNDTIHVNAVIQGGPSEKVGLMAGDRIVTVDDSLFVGKKVTNERAMRTLKGPKGSQVKLGIKRMGEKELLNFNITRGDIPQNTVEKVEDFEKLFSDINAGNCGLFVDTINIAFDIDIKGFQQRSIDSPNNEIVIKGSQEAFVENLRTNTSLLRRIVNNENLIIENVEVGKVTKTKCAVCYLQNITNLDLVAEVKYRLNNLAIDSLLSAGQLEQLISDSNEFGIPETMSTERPDKCAKYMLQGRIIVIVNGTPYALILPATLIDFMTSPEDTNLKVNFSNFLRGIRFLGAFLTLLLPGIYIAITSFHQEILPTELLFSILASRENVPFPVIVEILIMEISFELIREAGLRVPSPIGPTIGIVGALVLGQAAVSASIVSPILIIIVAITGIASFTIPDFSFGFHLRYFRFVFILLGYMAGFLGIGIGIFVYISILCSLKSFGVSFTAPLAPLSNLKGNGYFLPPVWKREYRPSYVAPQKMKREEKISMKWKYDSFGGDKNGK